jgi:hypothetical protein
MNDKKNTLDITDSWDKVRIEIIEHLNQSGNKKNVKKNNDEEINRTREKLTTVKGKNNFLK